MSRKTAEEIRQKKANGISQEKKATLPVSGTRQTKEKTGNAAFGSYSEWKESLNIPEDELKNAASAAQKSEEEKQAVSPYNTWKQRATAKFGGDWSQNTATEYDQINTYVNGYKDIVSRYVGNFDGSDLSKKWDNEGYDALKTDAESILRQSEMTARRLQALGFAENSDAMKQVKGIQDGLNSIISGGQNTHDFYEAWNYQPENSIIFNDLYTQYGYGGTAERKKQEDITVMNAQRRMDQLTAASKELQAKYQRREISRDEVQTRGKEIKQKYDEQKEIRDAAQKIIDILVSDDYAAYEAIMLTQKEDFEEKSRYKSTKNKHGQYGDIFYDMVNGDKEAFATYANNIDTVYDDALVDLVYRASDEYDYLTAMTEDEVAVYNYLYATDKDAASKYMESITPLLNERYGKELAVEDEELGRGIAASWQNGLYNWINSVGDTVVNALNQTNIRAGLPAWEDEAERRPLSVQEWEQSYLQENSSGLKRWAYSAARSAGETLPAQVVRWLTPDSFVGGIASSAVTALGSASMAYRDAIKRQGMDKEQAASYAVATGISEGFLEWLLGGIPGLKGWGVEKFGEKIAAKVGNALGRWSIKFGASIASEVLEENVQNYLEPLFVTLITGEDYDAPGWDDFVDTTMSTLLLTGTMNAVNAPLSIRGEMQETLAESEARFAAAAMTFDVDSDIYAAGLLVQNALDNGEVLDGKAFRSLISELGADKKTMKQIRSGKLTGEGYKSAFGQVNSDTVGQTEASESGRTGLSAPTGKNEIAAQLTPTENSVAVKDSAALNQNAGREETGSATSLTTASEADGRTGTSVPTANIRQTSVPTDENESTAQQTSAPAIRQNEKLRDATQVTVNGENATMTGIAYNDGDVQAIVRQTDGTIHKESIKNVSGLSDAKRSIITQIASVFRSAAPRVYAIHEAGQSVDLYLQGAETVFEVAQNSKKTLEQVMPELKNMETVKALSDFQIEQIWDAGKSAVDNGKTKAYSNSGTKAKDNSKIKEDTGDERTRVRIRESGKRSDGKSPGGTSRAVEKASGGDQSRKGQSGKSGKTQGTQGGSNEADARRVSARDLGISQGSTQKVLTQVSETFSKDTKRAQQFAQKNGQEVVFFTGENLRISTENGEIEARAYHIGNKLYVRADHPQFSAYQLAKHEHGHVLIAEGKLDAQSVRDRLARIAGEENVEWLSDIYTQAYEDAQLTSEQVWEEILCDSYADMNIFAELPVGEDIGAFLRETGRVIAEDIDLNATGTGTTRSDASIELRTLAELRKENDQLQKELERAQKQTEKLKKEFKITKMPTARLSDIDAMTRRTLKDYQSKAKFGDVRNEIKVLADSIFQSNENTSWNEIKEQAREIARKVVKEAAVLVNAEEMETYRGIKQYLRNQRLLFSESSDIADFKEFRKQYSRRLRLVEENGLPIDVAWMELQERYGEHYFPSDIMAQSDMAQYMAELLDSMQPIYENPYSIYIEEATEFCANGIIAEIVSERVRLTPPTFADKQKAKLDAERAKSKKALELERAKSKQAVKDATLAGQMAQGRKDAAVIRALRDTIERNNAKSKKALELEQERRAREVNALTRKIESDSVKNLRKQVEKTAKSLTDKLVVNSGKKHVPEVLKAPIAEFLKSLDFSSNRLASGKGQTINDAKHIAALTKLERVIQTQTNNPLNYSDGVFVDLRPDIAEKIESYIELATSAAKGLDTETNRVYAMDPAQLQDLNFILESLNHCVTKINEYYAEGRTEALGKDANGSIADMNSLGVKKRSGSAFEKFILWDNTLPFRAFERFGEGGKHVFETLMDGQDKLTKNLKTVLDFKGKTWSDNDAKQWKQEVREFKLSSGAKVKMTTAQVMSLYCLNERAQAEKHLLGGGIRISDIKTKKNGAIRQVDPILLTKADIESIISVLNENERAKNVAGKMLKFMSTVCSEWGNEVSMKRFGARLFVEEVYFPIESDKTVLATGDKEVRENSLFRLANLSATKSTSDFANNTIMIRDIFDVFSAHTSDMAKYNAMVLPLLDAIKWYNYVDTTKHDNGQISTQSVKRAMEAAYGKAANDYFTTLIEDLNGKSDAGRESSGWAGIMSRYKAAAVGWNLRVALLQPTAWFRAGAVLDYKYLYGALPMTGGMQEMLKYSEVAQWKDMGFPNINVGTPIRKRLSGETTWVDNVTELSMKGAGLGDKATWGAIWNACKLEQKTKYGLKGGALMDATKMRFREVIYATQVTDSTLTRSHNMRSKSSILMEATSFASEPTMTYNMLMSAATQFFGDNKKYGKSAAFRMNKKSIIRTFAVWSLSTVVTAVVESIVDAARDDDDYKTFLEKWSENFLGEYFVDGNLGSDMLVFNSLPFLRDIVSRMQGYENSSMYLEPLLSGIDFAEQIIDAAKNGLGNKTVYGLIYKGIQVASSLSGIPAGSAMRDVAALWNNTLGTLTGEKLKTYDPGDEAEIRQAYKDCYLSDEEAQELLLSKTDTESAEDAFWKVQSWKYGSKFGRLSQAISEGNKAEILAAKTEMLEHGYNESEFASKVRSMVKEELFAEGSTMTSDLAEEIMAAYCGVSRDVAKTTIECWELNNTWAQGEETEAREISFETYSKWKQYCKPANVSVEMFMDVRDYKASLVNTGKGKKEVLQYIQSLSLSYSQKDALYFALGYNESTLDDAPWR